jgi:hypothetical protein
MGKFANVQMGTGKMCRWANLQMGKWKKCGNLRTVLNNY